MKTKFLISVVATLLALPMFAQRTSHSGPHRENGRVETSSRNAGVRYREARPVQSSRPTYHAAEPHVKVRIGCSPVIIPPPPPVVIGHAPVVIYKEHHYREPLYIKHCVSAMNESEFFELKRTAQNMHMEEDKLLYVLQVIDNNFFTSEQIADLLYVFSFDRTKLKVAKRAYERTTDPRNYDLVYSAFSFESSAIELDEYISRG